MISTSVESHTATYRRKCDHLHEPFIFYVNIIFLIVRLWCLQLHHSLNYSNDQLLSEKNYSFLVVVLYLFLNNFISCPSTLCWIQKIISVVNVFNVIIILNNSMILPCTLLLSNVVNCNLFICSR